MDSKLLTSDTVPAYARDALSRAALSDAPIDLEAPLVAREIGDGNLNFAWSVHEAADEARAVFVKQAPEYIKCLGEGFALSAGRLLVESEVLEEYTAAAAAYVPRLLARDAAACAMVTEYLHGHELMRAALCAGHCPPSAATDVAAFMAITHVRTHACGPNASRWAHLENAAMCAITCAAPPAWSRRLERARARSCGAP